MFIFGKIRCNIRRFILYQRLQKSTFKSVPILGTDSFERKLYSSLIIQALSHSLKCAYQTVVVVDSQDLDADKYSITICQ